MPLAVLLFLILLPLPSCLSQQTCCLSSDISKCRATSITWVGDDAFIVKRNTDGAAFFVLMSRINRVPRHSHQYNDATATKKADFISLTVDGEMQVLVHWPRKKTMSFLMLGSIQWSDLVLGQSFEACSRHTPAPVQRLLNCHRDPLMLDWSLEQVSSFFSNDGRNSTLVGFYMRGDLTKAIAVSDDGRVVDQTDAFIDTSNTEAISGWHDVDGTQLALAVNSHGHLCFYRRPFHGFHFLVPDVSSKFMPQCMPSNMLFGCPQSFCFTGLVDEITQTQHEYLQTTTGKSVTYTLIFRGMHRWPIPMKHRWRKPCPLAKFQGNKVFNKVNQTVAAVLTLDAVLHPDLLAQGSMVMDDGRTQCMFHVQRHIPWNQDGPFDWLLCPDVTVVPWYFPEAVSAAFGPFDHQHFLFNRTVMRIVQDDDIDKQDYVRNEHQVDAMFWLDGVVYQKSGLFVWDWDTSTRKPMLHTSRPIIHDKRHNPNGLIDISFCNWSDQDMRQLMEAMNATSKWQDPWLAPMTHVLPTTTHASETNATASTTAAASADKQADWKKVASMMLLWIMAFLLCSPFCDVD